MDARADTVLSTYWHSINGKAGRPLIAESAADGFPQARDHHRAEGQSDLLYSYGAATVHIPARNQLIVC